MLANKENVLIHAPSHGAGKINPKTPGPVKLNPKTPYKVTLNDDKLQAGKSNLFAGKNPSMFVTPAGPRRAALTGKTTNAKARRAPQPGGGEEGQRSIQKIGRPARTRLSVTTEVAPILTKGGEVPEIEYMPPREIALPDIPDDFQIPDYEKLSKHIYSDCHRQYLYDIDESGKSKIQRQLEESERQISALLDAETDKMLSEIKPKRTAIKKAAVPKEPNTTATKLKHKRSTTLTDKPVLIRKRTGDTARPTSAMSNGSVNSRPSTAASIRAATALSQRPPSSASINRSATAPKTHSRSVSASLTKKPTNTRGEPTRPSSRAATHLGSRTTVRPTSHTATQPISRPNSRMAAANSKTTIGYTTGKEVARSVKKALEMPRMETALEICERILREDEERQNQFPVLFIGDEEEDIDDLLKTLLSMDEVFEEEEEFFLTVPDHE